MALAGAAGPLMLAGLQADPPWPPPPPSRLRFLTAAAADVPNELSVKLTPDCTMSKLNR